MIASVRPGGFNSAPASPSGQNTLSNLQGQNADEDDAQNPNAGHVNLWNPFDINNDYEIEIDIDPDDFLDFDFNARSPFTDIGNRVNDLQGRGYRGFNPFPGKENNPPRNAEE